MRTFEIVCNCDLARKQRHGLQSTEMVEKIWRAGLWIRLEQRIIRAQHELDEDGRVNGGHIYRRERFKQIERVTTNFCPKI